MKVRINITTLIRRLKKLYPKAKYYLDFSNTLELMVAVILSAQVRDETVNVTTPALFKKYKRTQDYAKASAKNIESIVSRIPFYRNKTKAIQGACKILANTFKGQVPDNMDDLISLPGIGRKSANAILTNGFNQVRGIIVDTHVIRLSQRLGLTKNKDPEKIEKDLMEVIPKAFWKQITWYLKDHGKAFCKAPKPLCDSCPLKTPCPKIGV
ncbi:endonuclease III [Elusimicrobiota bacterium]